MTSVWCRGGDELGLVKGEMVMNSVWLREGRANGNGLCLIKGGGTGNGDGLDLVKEAEKTW